MNQGIAYEVSGVMAAAVATGLFVSLCTIQQPDGALIGAGQPSGVYVDVSGLVALACMQAVPGFSDFKASELKTMEEIQATGMWHVLLNGYYPEATPDDQIPTDWRAVVDGVDYDILGVDHDSQHTQTRLRLQIVRV